MGRLIRGLVVAVIGFAYWDRRLAEVLRNFGLL